MRKGHSSFQRLFLQLQTGERPACLFALEVGRGRREVGEWDEGRAGRRQQRISFASLSTINRPEK